MFEWNDGTYLYHHGIEGMKWGVRRFENYDGTLTEEGKRRYSSGEGKKHNEDSDALASAAGIKFRELATLNEKKKAAQRVLGKDPKRFNQSKERQEYLDSMKRTQDAYDYTNALVKHLSEKYSEWNYDYKTEAKTGEMYVEAYLKDKLGDTYVSEIYLGYRVDD